LTNRMTVALPDPPVRPTGAKKSLNPPARKPLEKKTNVEPLFRVEKNRGTKKEVIGVPKVKGGTMVPEKNWLVPVNGGTGPGLSTTMRRKNKLRRKKKATRRCTGK